MLSLTAGLMSATVRDSMILYKQITEEVKVDRALCRCILDCVMGDIHVHSSMISGSWSKTSYWNVLCYRPFENVTEKNCSASFVQLSANTAKVCDFSQIILVFFVKISIYLRSIQTCT